MKSLPTRKSGGLPARTATAFAVFAGALALFGGSIASAGTLAGPAQVVKPDGVTQLNSGNYATNFTLRLPTAAKCIGDSTTGGVHVFGYFTQVDPATQTFDQSTGPVGGFPLVDTTGSPYVAANTAVGGQVIQIPTFNMTSYNTANATLPRPGTWNVGIACANTSGVENNYWNNQMVISASTDGNPDHFTWTVVPPNLIPESALAVALPLSAFAVIGGAVYVYRRRRRSTAPVA